MVAVGGVKGHFGGEWKAISGISKLIERLFATF